MPNIRKMMMGAGGASSGPDENTLLLIHSDTSDGSTTFVDSSQSGRTATVGGGCQHDTAQYKFGSSSILFDGSGDYLTFPDANEWKTVGDFTVDFWVRFASVGGYGDKQALVNQQSGSGNANTNFYVQLDSANKMEFAIGRDGGAAMTSGKPTTIFTTNTWYHIAMVVIGDSGGSLLMFVNGTLETTVSGDVQGTALSTPLRIGTTLGGVSDFDGWLDEIRISNVARWSANFTPETAPY